MTPAFMTPSFSAVPMSSRTAISAVIEIGSEAAFDKKIKSSGSALVIVDYSTTWCGPCKGTFTIHFVLL
jgi:thioredoxin 1